MSLGEGDCVFVVNEQIPSISRPHTARTRTTGDRRHLPNNIYNHLSRSKSSLNDAELGTLTARTITTTYSERVDFISPACGFHGDDENHDVNHPKRYIVTRRGRDLEACSCDADHVTRSGVSERTNAITSHGVAVNGREVAVREGLNVGCINVDAQYNDNSDSPNIRRLISEIRGDSFISNNKPSYDNRKPPYNRIENNGKAIRRVHGNKGGNVGTSCPKHDDRQQKQQLNEVEALHKCAAGTGKCEYRFCDVSFDTRDRLSTPAYDNREQSQHLLGTDNNQSQPCLHSLRCNKNNILGLDCIVPDNDVLGKSCPQRQTIKTQPPLGNTLLDEESLTTQASDRDQSYSIADQVQDDCAILRRNSKQVADQINEQWQLTNCYGSNWTHLSVNEDSNLQKQQDLRYKCVEYHEESDREDSEIVKCDCNFRRGEFSPITLGQTMTPKNDSPESSNTEKETVSTVDESLRVYKSSSDTSVEVLGGGVTSKIADNTDSEVGHDDARQRSFEKQTSVTTDKHKAVSAAANLRTITGNYSRLGNFRAMESNNLPSQIHPTDDSVGEALEETVTYTGNDLWLLNNFGHASFPTPPPSAMKKRGSIGSATKKQKVKFDLDLEIHVVPRDSYQPSPVDSVGAEQNDIDNYASVDDDDSFSLLSVNSDKEILSEYNPPDKSATSFDLNSTFGKLSVHGAVTPFRVIKREQSPASGRVLSSIPQGLYSARRDSLDLLQMQQFLKMQAKERALSSSCSVTTQRLSGKNVAMSQQAKLNAHQLTNQIKTGRGNGFWQTVQPNNRYINTHTPNPNRFVPRYAHLQLQRQYEEWEGRRRRKQRLFEARPNSKSPAEIRPSVSGQQAANISASIENTPEIDTVLLSKPDRRYAPGNTIQRTQLPKPKPYLNNGMLNLRPHPPENNDGNSYTKLDKRIMSADGVNFQGTTSKHYPYMNGDHDVETREDVESVLPQMVHPGILLTTLNQRKLQTAAGTNQRFTSDVNHSNHIRPRTSDVIIASHVRNNPLKPRKTMIDLEHPQKRKMRKMMGSLPNGAGNFNFAKLSDDARSTLKDAHKAYVGHITNMQLNPSKQGGSGGQMESNHVGNGYLKRSSEIYQSDQTSRNSLPINSRKVEFTQKQGTSANVNEHIFSGAKRNQIELHTNTPWRQHDAQNNADGEAITRSNQPVYGNKNRVMLSRNTKEDPVNHSTQQPVTLSSLGLTVHGPRRPGSMRSLGGFNTRNEGRFLTGMAPLSSKRPSTDNYTSQSLSSRKMASVSRPPQLFYSLQNLDGRSRSNQADGVTMSRQSSYKGGQAPNDSSLIFTPKIVA